MKMLRGELEKRDETIHHLSSSLAALSSRLENVEKSSSVESGRVGEGGMGERARVCVCKWEHICSEYLEKQQSELSSELSHTKSSLSIMMVSQCCRLH